MNRSIESEEYLKAVREAEGVELKKPKERVDAGGEDRGRIIDKRVEEIAQKELEAKLKEKNQYSLKVLESHKGDITGIASEVEEGEEITEELVRGAFREPEGDLAEGFFGMLVKTLNLLRPLENFDTVINAMRAEMDEKVGENLKGELYRKYYETDEGRKRLEEIRAEVEKEYKNE